MWSAETAVDTYRSLFREAPFTVVSNREPYVPHREASGALTYRKPAGGLTAALDPVMAAMGGTWIAWGTPQVARELGPAGREDRVRVPQESPAYELRRVWLSEHEVRNYYYGYANESLWPLCHNVLEHVRFRDRFWKAYQDVNRKFARAALEEIEAAGEPGVLWLHDYHLALAPELIRQERRDSRLAHFWHIPWPGWEIFRICPNHRQLLRGLLANDLLAFHLESFCENFMRCCEQDLDVLVDWKRRAVVHQGHVTTLRALPISIDAESYRELASSADTEERIGRLRERYDLGDKMVGIGVDRLDYSKGILERLDALRILFTRHPELVGRFTFIQIGAPSRTEIPAYAELQRSIEDAVEKLNRQLATERWRPVLYISPGIPHDELAAFFRIADVAIVSSLVDGMNLVAKEFVAAQIDRHGVLCLSEFAGAAEEFDHAIPINPFYTEGFAADIYRALTMDAREKRERMERMQATVQQGNVYRWIMDFLTALRQALDVGGRRARRRIRAAQAETPEARPT